MRNLVVHANYACRHPLLLVWFALPSIDLRDCRVMVDMMCQ